MIVGYATSTLEHGLRWRWRCQRVWEPFTNGGNNLVTFPLRRGCFRWGPTDGRRCRFTYHGLEQWRRTILVREREVEEVLLKKGSPSTTLAELIRGKLCNDTGRMNNFLPLGCFIFCVGLMCTGAIAVAVMLCCCILGIVGHCLGFSDASAPTQSPLWPLCPKKKKKGAKNGSAQQLVPESAKGQAKKKAVEDRVAAMEKGKRPRVSFTSTASTRNVSDNDVKGGKGGRGRGEGKGRGRGKGRGKGKGTGGDQEDTYADKGSHV